MVPLRRLVRSCHLNLSVDPLRVLLHPVQSIGSLLPPSSLLPGLLTVQVAAWAGHLPTPASSDRQDQQAKEQRSGGRHGHLKQWADRCR